MIGWAAIRKALVAWAEEVTGYTVRWANQTAPRPSYPYVTLLLGGPLTVGMDEALPQQGDIREVRGQRQVTLSVNVYSQQAGKVFDEAKSALHLVTLLQSSLALESVRGALRDVGLSVIEAGLAQDLTWLQDAAFVERQQMDVRFALASSVTEKTGYIATADVAQEGAP